ncbi:hypothetical protein LWP59_11315 [Amycolatopsis acidiphila]|uniref:Uncharacterized protein n=1 Tax=Amycolatopsis acidiphila TaxID=715473 RepID=A0A558ABF4_9PSEU|nr:hypothetical protein [Amycolatopsis acidiphila]TVT21589.1 hypothetical protein FNH06_16625 [Amycolatopsis acidiphila]UIJ62161.1 hypothetical protein LWP59_11315 [Amycolatopsis acidiphila]GHG92190.1 hypothetical protein GCM10017788_68960 [Amycolatopsis acidiphila]
MLYIVLILVLAALGLLVTALITATSLWAWVSIVLSVLAGLVLVADFVRRRSARRRVVHAATRVDAEPVEESEDDDAEEVAAESAEEPERAESGGTGLLPVTGEAGEDQASSAESGDPAEEATAPADAELVAKLGAEVVVVDEYPRYHVLDCPWLADRDTIPIAVNEARDLGFTPCARCTPDAKLATAHRATSKSRG